jgi:hypothetical protein
MDYRHPTRAIASKNMKREIKPSWTAEEKSRAEQQRRQWETFFTGRQTAPRGPRSGQAEITKAAAIDEIQQRHQAELLRYPNVVGVASGIRMRRGKPTGEPCIVVYVSRKVPKKNLTTAEILPRRLDGVPVDVVEVGELKPLSA